MGVLSMKLRFPAHRAALICSTILSASCAIPQAIAGELVGTVTDATITRSLPGAEIELVELGRRTTVAQDGTYRFTDVPAGTFTLRARYAGAPDKTVTIDVPDLGVAQLAITLGTDDSTILVIGQQANLASSISRQRSADGVKTVLTRDAIGQFPDQNVAESIRRAPGVNILNDQGEGRFVSVRGLDPNLNAASINGTRVPAPEADVRSVALDVIPSELIESIEIKKTLTPDMDADTIGASIEINTTSAFDRKKPFVALSVEGSHNDLTGKTSPKGSVDFATRLGDNFGIAGGLSYYKRRFATDNIEADDWTEEDGTAWAETLEYRDYDVERERLGASLTLDWRASDSTSFYARGLYSRFEDQEYRKRLIFDLADAAPVGGSGAISRFDTGEDGEIKVERDLKDRFEVQKIASVSVGGKTETGPWTFRYEGSLAKSSERENGSIDPIAFEREFDGDDPLGVDFDWSDYRKPAYAITHGNDAFSDPAGYELDKIERTSLSDAKDKEWTVRADITRSFALSSGTFDVQFGGKARLRDKTYDLNIDVYENGDITLADVLGKQDYDLGVIDPVASPKAVRRLLSGGFGDFELNTVDTAFESAAADFKVKEDIYAGYLMGSFDTGTLKLVGGVRMEHTKNDMGGNRVDLIEEGAPDGEDLVVATPVDFKRSYTDWLPSATLRYQAAKDVVVRLGASRSVVRPNMGQIAPRFMIEESDDGAREGEFGNPALEPYKAWNLDFSAEYYFARNAVIQIGAFYKTIDNFIVNAEFGADSAPYNGVFNGIAFDDAVIPINGEKAKVKGLEFSYQQALTFLPEPLDGLLVNFNYTFTDTEGKLADGRVISLPASSRHTFNAVLGYEKGPLSLRVAGAYRSGYLDEVGGTAEEDRHVRRHFQVDLSGKYRVTKNLQLFAEWVNVNDATYTAYQRGDAGNRLLQYEEYGWTAKFGARANF